MNLSVRASSNRMILTTQEIYRKKLLVPFFIRRPQTIQVQCSTPT